MAEITAQMVKQLREATGVGPLDCKKALEMHEGDMQKASDYLREKGLAKAAKKLGAGRSMNEGVIEVYQHFNKRIAVIVEVNCETDFVAKTEAFQTFAREIALHIVSAAPQYVRREDVPQAIIDHERDIQTRRAVDEGKPANIAEKVAEGRMAKFFEEIVLMEQPYYKDEQMTIEQFVKQAVAELGESIVIRRFARYALGELADDSAEETE
jgi:elongation factor Ts